MEQIVNYISAKRKEYLDKADRAIEPHSWEWNMAAAEELRMELDSIRKGGFLSSQTVH